MPETDYTFFVFLLITWPSSDEETGLLPTIFPSLVDIYEFFASGDPRFTEEVEAVLTKLCNFIDFSSFTIKTKSERNHILSFQKQTDINDPSSYYFLSSLLSI